MLLTKEVEVSLGVRTIKYYENLGYIIPKYLNNKNIWTVKRGTKIFVKVEDLTKGSNVTVQVQCDYCKKIYNKLFSQYNQDINNCVIKNDCCSECQPLKVKESNLINYNIESTNQLKEIINKKKITMNNPITKIESIKKRKKTNLMRYGFETPLLNEKIRMKIKRTNMKKYGVEYPQQNSEIKAKQIQSFYKNGTQKTSSQQLEIYNLFKENNYNVELNYPLSNINLDVAIFIDNIKINIEYDCWYWHKNKQKYDRRRDEFTKSQGWKVLRIKSSRKIPTLEQVKQSINKLITSDRTYTQIVLDDWQEKEVI